MIASPSFNYLSPKEYLATEEISLVKHEYHNGEASAIA
jgi:hypothetical protein